MPKNSKENTSQTSASMYQNESDEAQTRALMEIVIQAERIARALELISEQLRWRR